MATIIVIFAKVERHLGASGFKASTEHQNRDAVVTKSWYTVWTKDLPPVGSRVDIEGELTVKLDTWEDRETGLQKQAAAAHINKPKLKIHDAGKYMQRPPVDMSEPF